MNAIETIALVFSLSVVAKMIMAYVNPKPGLKAVRKLFKHETGITITYAALAFIVGAFVFKSMTVVQVAAAMTFGLLLMGISISHHPKPVLEMMQEFTKKKPKEWFGSLIWVVFALLVIYNLVV